MDLEMGWNERRRGYPGLRPDWTWMMAMAMVVLNGVLNGVSCEP
jgi:hypothetical protein